MKIVITSLMALCMSFLAACSSDDAASNNVRVIAESAETVDLTGEWKSSCYYDGDNNIYRVDVHNYTSSGSLVITYEKYDASDFGCSGASVAAVIVDDVTITGITVAGTKTMLGWVDGTGTSDAAPIVLYDGQLSATPTVSKATGTLNGQQVKLIVAVNVADIVEEPGSKAWTLYRAYDSDPALLDADGYPDYIGTADPLDRRTVNGQ